MSTVWLMAGDEEVVWSPANKTTGAWPSWLVTALILDTLRLSFFPPLPGEELKMGTATDLPPILMGTTGEGTGNDCPERLDSVGGGAETVFSLGTFFLRRLGEGGFTFSEDCLTMEAMPVAKRAFFAFCGAFWRAACCLAFLSFWL